MHSNLGHLFRCSHTYISLPQRPYIMTKPSNFKNLTLIRTNHILFGIFSLDMEIISSYHLLFSSLLGGYYYTLFIWISRKTQYYLLKATQLLDPNPDVSLQLQSLGFPHQHHVLCTAISSPQGKWIIILIENISWNLRANIDHGLKIHLWK